MRIVARLMVGALSGALLFTGCLGYVGDTGLDPGGPGPTGSGGSGSGNGNGGASGLGGTPAGQGGSNGIGGSNGSGGGGGVVTVPSTGLPCDVQALVQTRCQGCHGSTLANGAPMPLVTRAHLMTPSIRNVAQTFAQRALERVQAAAGQMPPAPAARATAAEIQALSNWVAAGYPNSTCSSGGIGGASGTGGMITGVGGASGVGGRAGTGGMTGTTAGGLPCDVQAVYQSHCTTCHAASPVNGAPMPLVTRANLMAASFASMTQTFAQRTVVRMQSTTAPMPPAPGTRATTAEITTINNWISAGYPAGTCGGTPDGGAGADSGVVTPPDPLGLPARCTSGTTWTGGNNGSSVMNPGRACIACHVNEDAPRWTIAGTVYPTGHEPNLCNGANGTNGARVVIVDAMNRTITLVPNAAGNFMTTTPIATPYRAKITYQGRERIMPVAQTSGDCNNCHTQTGANGAPGRITLP